MSSSNRQPFQFIDSHNNHDARERPIRGHRPMANRPSTHERIWKGMGIVVLIALVSGLIWFNNNVLAAPIEFRNTRHQVVGVEINGVVYDQHHPEFRAKLKETRSAFYHSVEYRPYGQKISK